jgi:hypothetical protein
MNRLQCVSLNILAPVLFSLTFTSWIPPLATFFAPTSERLSSAIVFEVIGRELSPPVGLEEIRSVSGEQSAFVAAADVLKAMLDGDFEAWLETWDSGGKEFYSARTIEAWGAYPKRTAQETAEGWRDAFGGNEVVIVAELIHEDRAIVAYEVRRPGCQAPLGTPGFEIRFTQEDLMRGRVFLVNEGTLEVPIWRQSGRYASHPVSLLWRSGRSQLERKATAGDWGVDTEWPPAR